MEFQGKKKKKKKKDKKVEEEDELTTLFSKQESVDAHQPAMALDESPVMFSDLGERRDSHKHKKKKKKKKKDEEEEEEPATPFSKQDAHKHKKKKKKKRKKEEEENEEPVPEFISPEHAEAEQPVVSDKQSVMFSESNERRCLHKQKKKKKRKEEKTEKDEPATIFLKPDRVEADQPSVTSAETEERRQPHKQKKNGKTNKKVENQVVSSLKEVAETTQQVVNSSKTRKKKKKKKYQEQEDANCVEEPAAVTPGKIAKKMQPHGQGKEEEEEDSAVNEVTQSATAAVLVDVSSKAGQKGKTRKQRKEKRLLLPSPPLPDFSSTDEDADLVNNVSSPQKNKPHKEKKENGCKKLPLPFSALNEYFSSKVKVPKQEGVVLTSVTTSPPLPDFSSTDEDAELVKRVSSPQKRKPLKEKKEKGSNRRLLLPSSYLPDFSSTDKDGVHTEHSPRTSAPPRERSSSTAKHHPLSPTASRKRLSIDSVSTDRDSSLDGSSSPPMKKRQTETVSDQQTVCYVCKESVATTPDYIVHLAKVHGIASYQCPKCSSRLLSESLLNHHLHVSCKARHSGLAITPFHCKLCPLSYSSRPSLNRHMWTEHGIGVPIVHECQVCKMTFTTGNKQRRHQAKCAEGLLRRSGERGEGLECSQCGKLYASRQSLYYHCRTIHQQHVFECVCGETFRTSNSLYAHKKVCI